MVIINEITSEIVKNARNGESIRSLAFKVGFAYSAVYKWLAELEKYGVVNLVRAGNKTVIKLNKNLIYEKFKELEEAVSVIEKDKLFWDLIKRVDLRLRFVRGTAATIWTKGSFITGDFYDKIYFLEVESRDASKFKQILEEHEIDYTQRELTDKRPLVYIIPKNNLKVDIKDNLPIMPLPELVKWCKNLELENVLEQLKLLYGLKLKVSYSEVYTNV